MEESLLLSFMHRDRSMTPPNHYLWTAGENLNAAGIKCCIHYCWFSQSRTP